MEPPSPPPAQDLETQVSSFFDSLKMYAGYGAMALGFMCMGAGLGIKYQLDQFSPPAYSRLVFVQADSPHEEARKAQEGRRRKVHNEKYVAVGAGLMIGFYLIGSTLVTEYDPRSPLYRSERRNALGRTSKGGSGSA